MGNSFGTINKTLLNYSFSLPERRGIFIKRKIFKKWIDHSRLDFVLGELDSYDEYEHTKEDDFRPGKDLESSPKIKSKENVRFS